MGEGEKERGKRKENKPREPINELKEAATTTVGSMKGMAVNTRRRDLPRNSNLENRMADGIPRMKVRMVERKA